VADLETLSACAGSPVPADIGELAEKPAVGETVERLVALWTCEMR
jgi:hypothetical protein